MKIKKIGRLPILMLAILSCGAEENLIGEKSIAVEQENIIQLHRDVKKQYDHNKMLNVVVRVNSLIGVYIDALSRPNKYDKISDDDLLLNIKILTDACPSRSDDRYVSIESNRRRATVILSTLYSRCILSQNKIGSLRTIIMKSIAANAREENYTPAEIAKMEEDKLYNYNHRKLTTLRENLMTAYSTFMQSSVNHLTDDEIYDYVIQAINLEYKNEIIASLFGSKIMQSKLSNLPSVLQEKIKIIISKSDCSASPIEWRLDMDKTLDTRIPGSIKPQNASANPAPTPLTPDKPSTGSAPAVAPKAP